MNRREFIFGSAACAAFPFSGNAVDSEIIRKDAHSRDYRLNEMLKCKKDIIYFAENYVKLPYGKPLELKDWQKKYLKHLASGKDALLSAHRQAGKTSLNIIYAIWKISFSPCKKITFVTAKKRMSEICFDVAETIYSNLPRWMQHRDALHEHYMHAGKHIVLKNASELVVTYANADFCGYHPGSMIIFDEFAFFSSKEHMNVVRIIPVATSCENSQMMAASTPQFADDVFSEWVKYFRLENEECLFEIAKS